MINASRIYNPTNKLEAYMRWVLFSTSSMLNISERLFSLATEPRNSFYTLLKYQGAIVELETRDDKALDIKD